MSRYDSQKAKERLKVAVVVAHPDDETLWAGGTILSCREWECFVACLCRGYDPDRAPRFWRALARLGACGAMADVDDGPEQNPLPPRQVEREVLRMLPRTCFDIVLTHGPKGEYTRHRRHEETSRAVTALWRGGEIRANALWLFAYEDGGGRHLPRAAADAHRRKRLSDEVWLHKYEVITGIYGFDQASFEARTAPREEAFWCFEAPHEVQERMIKRGEGT